MILTNPHTYLPVDRTTGKYGRYYKTKDGRPLPSVTTILSNTKDMSFLVKWRQEIGDKEADKIVEQATTVGNALHDNLEHYVLTKRKPEGNMLTKILTDLVIKKGLSKVDEVWGTEVPLYANDLWAGTTDLVGVHQGVPAIMDFKNSRKYKTREFVEDYFLQLVAYGEAHNEMYGTTIDKGVIMMGCWTGHYLEFVIEGDEYRDYRKKWYDRLYEYYNKCGIE